MRGQWLKIKLAVEIGLPDVLSSVDAFDIPVFVLNSGRSQCTYFYQSNEVCFP